MACHPGQLKVVERRQFATHEIARVFQVATPRGGVAGHHVEINISEEAQDNARR